MLLAGTLDCFSSEVCCSRSPIHLIKVQIYLLSNVGYHVEGWGSVSLLLAKLKTPDYVYEKVMFCYSDCSYMREIFMSNIFLDLIFCVFVFFKVLISVSRNFWILPDRQNVFFYKRDCSCLCRSQSRLSKRYDSVFSSALGRARVVRVLSLL